ncbi:hypothetical protein [Eubacterium aggregans]|uniref:hypothetical protein n=1 Tax=Eubacterium aggregans TaxID=81409 RepID=UPI003F3431F3
MNIVLLVWLLLLLIGGAVFLLYLKKQEKANDDESVKKKKEDTVNDFINVKDIQESILYLQNGVAAFVKVQPINPELMSIDEKKGITKRLSAEFSGIDFSFKLICVYAPTDASEQFNYYQNLMDQTNNPIRQEILCREINELAKKIDNAEIPKRNFYLMVLEAYGRDALDEVQKRAKGLVARLAGGGISSEVIGQK